MYIFEDGFEVRIAKNTEEIKESQKLRYEVFIEEMGGYTQSEASELQLERDEFDEHCQHLLLIDRNTKVGKSDGKVVGVMRLMLGSEAELGKGFCSAQEYDLGVLIKSGKKCLELGRTCVDPSYRNGLALHYLWKGLGSYATSKDVDLLFGLASFPGNNVDQISMALSLMHVKYLAPKRIRPKAITECAIDMEIIPKTKIDKLKALGQMPSLLKSYLRLGAMVGEGAFIDRVLNTIDICIIIDLHQMPEKYREYYGKTR